MPFFIKEKGFTIGVTKDDIEDYKKTHGGETYPLSFVQYLKDKMKLPYYQPVTIEAKYKDKQAYKEATKPGFTGTPSYLDLSTMDLSGLDLSDRDYDDSKSRIIFDNVKFGPKTGLSKTNFSGTTLKNLILKDTDIADAITTTKTKLEDVDLAPADEYKLNKKELEYQVIDHKYNASAVDDAISGFHKRSKGGVKKVYAVLKDALSSSYLNKKGLNIDQALTSLRAEHLRRNPSTTTKSSELLEKAEKVGLSAIGDIYDEKVKKTQSWGKYWKSWAVTDTDHNKVKKLILDSFKKDDFLKKHFLINQDYLSLNEFLENSIPSFHKSFQDLQSDEERQKSIDDSIESWKVDKEKARIERWEGLKTSVKEKTPKKHAEKIEETWIEELSKKTLPSSISPTETSSWPRIRPDDIKAKERDLELKKEGLRMIAVALRTGAATATSARILTVGSVMGILSDSILGLGAAGVVGYKFLEKKMTLENYDQFDSQFGDRLLEIAVAKKACEKTAALVAGNAVTELVLDKIFTQSLATNTIKSVLKPLNALGQYALINNVKASYNFIQGEKNKVSYNRHRPGDPSFENSLNEKLFDTKTVLIYGAISGVLVGGFILSSVFAGPAIAPFMATIGALSATELTLAGGAALAILTTLGSTIHKKSKYYFNKLRNNLTKPKQAPTIPIGRGKEIPVDAIDKKTETPEHTKERPKDVEHTKEKEKDEFFDAVEHPETAKKIEKEKEEDKMKLEAAKKILKERKKTQSKLGKNVKRLIKQRENKQSKSVRRK